jgi:hypothetical protein
MSHISRIRLQVVDEDQENVSWSGGCASAARFYAYVNNDPLNLTDPSGLLASEIATGAYSLIQNFNPIGTANAAVPTPGQPGVCYETECSPTGLPGGSSPGNIGGPSAPQGEIAPAGRPVVSVPYSQYPQAAQHIDDAQAAGQPSVLTINRPGAAANRNAATAGVPAVPGMQLDEYPPAMFQEGGAGASVRPINPSDNMGAGACIGNQCRPYSNGTQVIIRTTP